MFRWKKRDEGFEWHKYVRTTIKLRREARRKRAHDLGAQLAEGAKAASVAADAMARGGAEKGAKLAHAARGAAGRWSVAGFAAAGMGLGSLSRWLGRVLAPLIDLLGRPGVAGPLVFIGALAALAGVGRALFAGNGLDTEALVALGVGSLALLLGLAPAALHGHGALPKAVMAPIKGLPPRPVLIPVVAALALVAAYCLFTLSGGRLGLPSVAGLPVIGSAAGADVVSGAARAVAGDVLGVGDASVRLAGIEVPYPDQRCYRPGGRIGGRGWACGEEAREALQRLIRGQTVRCEIGSRDSGGQVRGRCNVAGADIGEAMVRAGHAFAEEGFFRSGYGAAQEAAKAARLGVWAQTEPERPAVWRDRLWTEAKQKAPDGCPIKARARGSERVYLLPWSADYQRVRVDTKRGDRWFCTEDEAQAAGWRSPRRG